MISVCAFTGGKTVPSARFRVRQYISHLVKREVEIHEMIPLVSTYPPSARWLRPLWAAAKISESIPNMLRSHCFDKGLFQRELLSQYMTVELLAKRPCFFDVDDAIHLFREGACARRMALMSNHVICGNSFLAEWYSRWNRSVSIVPTAVDTDLYVPDHDMDRGQASVTIGWIGTSGNLKYFDLVEDALAKVFVSDATVRLRIVCDKMPKFTKIDLDRVDFIKWSRDIEIKSIQNMDIGIMPLSDSLWERGKCSFKMLQYMSCGIPVVVSPVGMNNEVLAAGDVGFSANDEKQWIDALLVLVKDSNLRKKMGEEGRRIVVEKFSVSHVASKLAAILHYN